MTIPAILQENTRQWAERDAIIAARHGRDVRISFARLESAANGFAGELAAKGVRPGDAVLVFVPMSLELYIGLLGIFRLGAVAVFIDPSASLRFVSACCAMLPPAAFLGIWPLRFLRPFIPELRKIPRTFAPPHAASMRTETPLLPPFPSPLDPALITFTSGSTGAPKAAVRTHQFLLAQHVALKTSIHLEPGERDLTTLPIFVLANLASGVTSVLPDAKISKPGAVDSVRVARQIQRLQPTRTGGSPAFYQRLAAEPASLRSFRKIYTGGAPVFPSLLRRLQDICPDSEVVAVYGSTEAEPIAHIACREISSADWQAMREGKGLLAGLPIAEVRLRIISDQWGGPASAVNPLSAGETGEILVTGDHVLKGYLNGKGDEETKVRIEGEIWHRTGDAGYLDASGRLWLMGRCSARIQDARGTLYPFAAECVAMTFPFIHRAAFVSVNGKRILASEGNRRLAETDLSQLKSALSWASPDEIRVLRRIPVDARHNAKVNYPKLQKLL